MVTRRTVMRGLAEFVLIVAGVLTALAVDEFRESRRDAAQERSYLLRLVVDLRADSARLPTSDVFARRGHRLEQLLSASSMRAGPAPSADSLALWISSASRVSWGYPPAERGTFNELESTGSFGLIRDVPLRASIARYYTDYEFYRELVLARQTEFPTLGYRLVLRDADSDFVPDTVVDVERLFSAVVSDEFKGAVTAEINRNRRFEDTAETFRGRATQLLAEVCAYLGGCPPAST